VECRSEVRRRPADVRAQQRAHRVVVKTTACSFGEASRFRKPPRVALVMVNSGGTGCCAGAGCLAAAGVGGTKRRRRLPRPAAGPAAAASSTTSSTASGLGRTPILLLLLLPTLHHLTGAACAQGWQVPSGRVPETLRQLCAGSGSSCTWPKSAWECRTACKGLAHHPRLRQRGGHVRLFDLVVPRAGRLRPSHSLL
jgi:hypothetical protein